MQDIIILSIGKVKEKATRALIDEYLKRIPREIKVAEVELKAENFTDKTETRACEIEGSRLLEYLGKNKTHRRIILDEGGRQMPSQNFSEYLHENPKVIFVIGGSIGLSSEVKAAADEIISLSELTMPHELARLVLAEQIYRAYMIGKGRKYHY